ncbi:MAG: M43 family zinc metalloprotease [Raineya sp.]|nr:M43 family zinc metalloprotease [Raineya sp.]
MTKNILLLCFFFMSFGIMAQEKCASHKHEEEMRKKYPQLGTKDDFENWMARKIAERQSNFTKRVAPYKVPVIIHVIHAGEAVANNSVNIPYGQAMSQIRVLNQDFQKTNPDFSSNVLAIFQARAGSLDITFEPATKDPNGVPLTEVGVNRINGATASWGGGRTSWSTADCDNILKPNTIWDPTQYCNIWVVRFSGSDDTGLFGYAQFPQGSTLPGVPGGGTALTDGVVINWRAFGSNYDAAGVALPTPYVSSANLICSNCDRGRTLTHEIGHWLGLRHIWGDGEAGCANPNNNDYCQDTPFTTSSNNPTTGCPARLNKCTSLEPSYGNVDTPDQRENYMDYSSDGCMGMFSINQLQRVETVLLNSPRRVELLTSTAAAPINPNAITANFTASTISTCAGQSVTFTNTSTAGSSAAPINSWTWNFDVTGVGGATPPSPATFSGQNPPAVTFTTPGTYQVRLTISNGTTTDDEIKNITILAGNALPITTGFEGSASGWTVGNSGGSANWSISNTVGQTGTGSAWVNLFNVNIGTNSLYLYPPLADLQGYGSASFQFYVAYTTYNADYATLTLEASTNCGTSYTTLWTKTGTALSTTSPTSTTSNWTPTAAQWRLENVDISSLIGNRNVQFRFKLTDNFSNNIYIDNVNISGVSSSPPTTPSGLTATAVSSSQINLSWTDNATNETGYKVERSPDGSTGWAEIAGSLPAGTTSYSNTGLTANTTYHYRVRANNGTLNSAYSNVANATTLPNPPSDPTGLTATAVNRL